MGNPRATTKQITLYESTTLTGAVNGAAVDIRGMEDLSFILEALDLATGGSYTDETLDVHIEGRNSSDDAWVDIPGLTFTQITANTGGQILPAAGAVAQSMVLPNWIRVVAVSAGTADIVTFNVLARFNRPRGGKRVSNGPLS